MQKRKSGQETFGEKIADILTPVPNFFDPEDDVNEETRAKVVNTYKNENDDEVNDELVGQFRKANIELLEDVDKRYEGKKSSRKSVKEDEFDSDDLESDKGSGLENDEEESENDIYKLQSKQREKEKNDDIEVEEEESEDMEAEEDEIEDDEDGDEEEVNEYFENEGEDQFKHISNIDVKNQFKKGTCVRNQLNIWESLLELRIQMQKCLLTANKMPQREHFEEIKLNSGHELTNKVSETKSVVSKTLDKLLLLQSLLLKKYPETKKLSKGEIMSKETEQSDEEIPSDTEEEKSEEESEGECDKEVPKKKLKLSDYENEISKRHKLYREYQNSVIQKWNEKTRVAVAKTTTPSYSVVNQIQHILTDRQRLLKRTQLKRSNYEILGLKPDEKQNKESETEENQKLQVEEEYNPNIFDDDDFYHQLLRELIEFKSADVSDPVQLGRQWIQLQNLRSKMKRKIDTRATKGRKVRYAVHSKLVNFMAPIDEGLMTDEAKNELFSSLFGKNQPVLKI